MSTRRRLLLALLPAGLLAFVVGAAVYATGVLSGTEQSTINARFAVRSSSTPQRFLIVAIDPRTFTALRRSWPFPRSLHGEAIDRLRRDGARVIVYDVQFTTPTTPVQDNALYGAVARARGTVLATSQMTNTGQTDVLGGNANLAAVGAEAASSNLLSNDGLIDRFPFATSNLPSIAVVATEHATGRRVAPSSIPSGGALIDYRGGPSTFPTVSFSDLLAGRVSPSLVRGRIVFVGVTDPSLHDVYSTPTTDNDLMSGVEIWANATWSLLHGLPLADAAGWLSILIIAALAFVAPLARLRLRLVPVALGALVLGVLYVVVAQLAFDAGLVLPVVAPLVALLVGVVGAIVASNVLDNHERARVARENELLERRVDERTRELRESQVEIIRRLAQAVELRDLETGRHLESMASLAYELALALGLDPAEAQLLRYASMLHDVGKVGIPDNILLKPGPLESRERAIVNQHTVIGADILAGSPSSLVRMAETIARTHHERWDGTGYPARLRGEEIPLVGRICAVCDVYDALTAERPYKPAWTRDQALAVLRRERGRHFDPRVVDAFLALRGGGRSEPEIAASENGSGVVPGVTAAPHP